MIFPRALFKLWFLIIFLISFLLLYPVFLILLSREKWFRIAFSLMRFWAKWMCYCAGIIPRIKHETDEIPSPCIFVSNHCSYLDIPLSYVVIRQYFVFVAKQELQKAPLFRIFFKRMNILVNRKSTLDSHRAYLEAGERIDKGQSVFIFPEATISSSGIMIPFKNGAFKLAIDKQLPIVPLVFRDNWKLLQNGGFFTSHGRPGTTRIIIKKTVSTKGMTISDLIPLREKVRSIIAETLNQNRS